MTQHLRALCVYCGSAAGSDPDYCAQATEFGVLLAKANIRLVYGGGGTGMMGAVARGVLGAGGHVTGIIPTFLKAREVELKEASEMIVVQDMHTRKKMMFDLSDAFVALPGGVGTLEELTEQMTWAQIGQHRKPILIANIGHFWSPLLALFDHMREKHFIRSPYEVRPLVVDDVGAIIPALQAAMPARDPVGDTALMQKL